MVNNHILRHLCFGWFGFAQIIRSASINGYKLDAEDIKKLEDSLVSIKEAIDKQKELNGIGL